MIRPRFVSIFTHGLHLLMLIPRNILGLPQSLHKHLTFERGTIAEVERGIREKGKHFIACRTWCKIISQMRDSKTYGDLER